MAEEFLFYGSLYVAIGLLVGVIIAVVVYFKEVRSPAGVAVFEERVWSETLLNLAKAIALSMLWPGILASGLGMLLDKCFLVNWREQRKEQKRNQPWKPSIRDLGRKMTVSDAEQQNLVLDPLGAVPDLPFGHFAMRWLEFRGDMPVDGSIWWFDTIGSDKWGREHIARGYAVRKWWWVDRVFLTEFLPMKRYPWE